MNVGSILILTLILFMGIVAVARAAFCYYADKPLSGVVALATALVAIFAYTAMLMR